MGEIAKTIIFVKICNPIFEYHSEVKSVYLPLKTVFVILLSDTSTKLAPNNI
jgi:hypothetical protein